MALRFKTQLNQRLLLVLATACFVTACGSKGKNSSLPRTSQEFNDMGVTDSETSTGATAPDGKQYTSYSPASEVQEVKEGISDSDENKKFGAQIEKASVVYKTSTAPNTNPLVITVNKIEVKIKWQGLPKDLSFQGLLNSSGKTFVSQQMSDTSGQRPDLSMSAICTDVDCYHGQFKIADTQGHNAAIIINKQTRTLRLKVPVDPQAAGYSASPFADQFKTGKPVIVTTTEIYPGKSYYEIEEITANKETPGLKLSGDLEEPSGDAVPVQVNDSTQDSGKASLIGNDEQGSLLFKFTPMDDSSATSVDDTPEPADDAGLPNQPTSMPKGVPGTANSKSAKPAPQDSNSGSTSQPVPIPQNSQSPATPLPATQAPPPARVTKHRLPAVYLELDDGDRIFTNEPAAAPNHSQTSQPHRPSQPQAPTTEPTTNTGNGNPSPYAMNACPIQANANSSAMIQQIMKDCGNSEVEKYIYGSWAKAGGRPKGWHVGDPEPRLPWMQRFLYINELRQEANPKPDSRDKRSNETMTKVSALKTIIDILDAEKFPEIWSLITLQESNLNNMAVGADGEFGVWQFMTGTASVYGLAHVPQVNKDNDQRRNVALETKAAVKYYRDLLNTWNGDIKMALASYNRGGPGVQQASRTIEKQVNQGKIEIPEFTEAYAISHDFWYIYKHRMILQRKGQWEYVPSALAAMFTAVAPQQYGVESVQAMELK